MKKKIGIISVIVFTTIYCFAIATNNKAYIHSDFNNYLSLSQEKDYSDYSDFSIKLFCHTSQTVCSANNFNKLPSPNFKSQFYRLWAIKIADEQLFESAFSQIKTLARNIPINKQRTVVLFPFHYFW